MPRFDSLRHAPAATRSTLRSRLSRYLHYQTDPIANLSSQTRISDESLLKLLSGLTINFACDFVTVSNDYMAWTGPETQEPTLGDLLEQGWIERVWGRVTARYPLIEHVRNHRAREMPALLRLFEKIHREEYTFSPDVTNSQELLEVTKSITSGKITPHGVESQDRAWVAARLWDRSLEENTDPVAALRAWVDRWIVLGYPQLDPVRIWSSDALQTFRDASTAVLRVHSDLLSWDQKRSGLVRLRCQLSGQKVSEISDSIPRIPDTVLGRALWLSEPSVRNDFFFPSAAYEGIGSLVTLLLRDIATDELAPAPHPVAEALLEIATDFPDVMYFLTRGTRTAPNTIADMLLVPKTCVLGCWSVANWEPAGGASDRPIAEESDRTTHAIAFDDALGVMEYFVDRGDLPHREAAALVSTMYRRRYLQSPRGAAPRLTGAFTKSLRSRPPQFLRTMFKFLCADIAQIGIAAPPFLAALDIAEILGLPDDIDATVLVDAYADTVINNPPSSVLPRLSTRQAATLADLSLRTDDLRRSRFLNPLRDSHKHEQGTASTEDSVYRREHRKAQSIRLHIRTLSRALLDSPDARGASVLDSLIAAVREGALQHREKGRVAALAADFETWPFRDAGDIPVASDIGAALDALPNPERQRLLEAVLETDEPMFLAQVLSSGPRSVRDRIARRVDAIRPDTAGSISSLSAAQARIDALLSAGLVDAAGRYLEHERGIKTLGRVSGRENTRLQQRLRLCLLREEWSEIAASVPPKGLSPHERNQSKETIDFYTALAELRNPSGNKARAEDGFRRLCQRNKHVPAYAINLLAVRLSILFGQDLFPRLRGKSLIHANHLLKEFEEVRYEAATMDPEHKDHLRLGRALLLLAVGENDDAERLLLFLYGRHASDELAAYLAVARFRLNRASESAAILKDAEDRFGMTEILERARADSVNGPVASETNEKNDVDKVSHIRSLIGKLRIAPPELQACALTTENGSHKLATFVTERVRLAAASLVEIVPTWRNVSIPYEDDISTHLREFLIARFEIVSWSVSDQSVGGFSARGNPGKRDLVIRKDSIIIAIVEAIVYRLGTTRQKLASHLKRLFGYSTCALFVYLAYTDRVDLKSSLDKLRGIAESEAPKGWQFQDFRNIEQVDSRPPGFVARYKGEARDVKVIFLLLDIGQTMQRDAAIEAGRRRTDTS